MECDRCKVELDKELWECIESNVYDNDETTFKSNGNIFRFCHKCWDEMIEYLLSEGKL
jgi:hypothetical protein